MVEVADSDNNSSEWLRLRTTTCLNPIAQVIEASCEIGYIGQSSTPGAVLDSGVPSFRSPGSNPEVRYERRATAHLVSARHPRSGCPVLDGGSESGAGSCRHDRGHIRPSSRWTDRRLPDRRGHHDGLDVHR